MFHLYGAWSAIGLVSLAILLGCAARRLDRARWLDRSPALGIAVWQSLTVSFALSIVLAVAAMLMPQMPASTSVLELLSLCRTALQQQLSSPVLAATCLAALTLLAAGALRLVAIMPLRALDASRVRTAQRRTLSFVGRSDEEGTTVIDHAVPAVYCVPGRGGRIVVTRAARESLSPKQLRGVIAHERCHLRRRHHIAVGHAEGLARAFPHVRLFRLSADNLSRLVEMQADDAAGATARTDLAVALLTLGAGPSGLLSAGGDTVARARRLVEAQAPLSPLQRLAAGTASAALVLLPLMIAVLPAPVEQVCCGAAVSQQR